MKKRNEETETPKQKGEKMDIQTEEERVNQVQIKQEMIEKTLSAYFRMMKMKTTTMINI